LLIPEIDNIFVRTSILIKCKILTVLETTESIWKLVSKERFLKLKVFTLKMLSMFAVAKPE